MPSISETVGNTSQINAVLDAGLATISRNQSISFTEHKKKILPADGYVFWVSTGNVIEVTGSLHYGTDKEQNEDETIAVNRVIFTAESQIAEFNLIDPDTMYIGTFEGIRFSFSRQGNFYERAGLWHYVGIAIFPAFASQIISCEEDTVALVPIVSNSLPIWLDQSTYCPVYPSFLVPDNAQPPYIVAHIEPESTDALQAFPSFQWPGSTPAGAYMSSDGSEKIVSNANLFLNIGKGKAAPHQLPSYQLMRERVRLTLYGFNNTAAIQFLSSLIQYSINTDNFGFMNSPAIRDDKRHQVELSALAQKKHIDLIVSYYQTTAAAIAERIIVSASASITTSRSS